MKLAGSLIALAAAFVIWNLADGALYDGRMFVAIVLLLIAFVSIIIATERRITQIEHRKESNR